MNTKDVVGGGAIATSVGSVASAVGIVIAWALFAFVVYRVLKSS